MPTVTAKMEIFSILGKTSSKIDTELSRRALFQVKTRVCLKYFLNDCLWKNYLLLTNLRPLKT